MQHDAFKDGFFDCLGFSILTGPFGPVQRVCAGTGAPGGSCFNPHRPFRAGATIHANAHVLERLMFQSSPALSGRCNLYDVDLAVTAPTFQSSPALSGRCNFWTSWPLRAVKSFQSSPALSGRCNYSAIEEVVTMTQFQSSPALSGRCNMVLSIPRPRPAFQSSPALSGRCNGRGHCKRYRIAPCFNPHRPFRAGATPGTRVKYSRAWSFQSSPALSGRCNN